MRVETSAVSRNESVTEDKSQILFQHMTIKGDMAHCNNSICDVRINSRDMRHYVRCV
jgi:hypothetical protein